MSSISAVGMNHSYQDYGKFASGKKIQSVADGAAELTIIEKEDAQIRGYKAGENNIGSARDMLNIADGAMGGITDYLQRIRELGVRAANTATVTDAERESMQKEIDQLKQGISDLAGQTTYNTKHLLDGSYDKFQIATDGNGNSIDVTTTDATLQMLGIADFDVTKDFNLQDIDEALEKSRLEDLDYPQAISEKKKKETLQEYALFMQKRKIEQQHQTMFRMFA